MLLRMASLLALVAFGLTVYAEWVGNKIASGFSYLALSGVLFLIMWYLCSGVVDGRAADDDAHGQGLVWSGIAGATAVGFGIVAMYKLLSNMK